MATVICPIELPKGYKILAIDCYSASDDSIAIDVEVLWRTPVGDQWSSVRVNSISPELWQDMLEQVQIYVRMKEKAR